MNDLDLESTFSFLANPEKKGPTDISKELSHPENKERQKQIQLLDLEFGSSTKPTGGSTTSSKPKLEFDLEDFEDFKDDGLDEEDDDSMFDMDDEDSDPLAQLMKHAGLDDASDKQPSATSAAQPASGGSPSSILSRFAEAKAGSVPSPAGAAAAAAGTASQSSDETSLLKRKLKIIEEKLAAAQQSAKSASVAPLQYTEQEQAILNNIQNRELREKIKLLKDFHDLERDGVPMTRKFNLEDNLDEMRLEHFTLKSDQRTDQAVKTIRCLMITGIVAMENLNAKYDPFGFCFKNVSTDVLSEWKTDFAPIVRGLHKKYSKNGAANLELQLASALGQRFLASHLNNSQSEKMKAANKPRPQAEPAAPAAQAGYGYSQSPYQGIPYPGHVGPVGGPYGYYTSGGPYPTNYQAPYPSPGQPQQGVSSYPQVYPTHMSPQPPAVPYPAQAPSVHQPFVSSAGSAAFPQFRSDQYPPPSSGAPQAPPSLVSRAAAPVDPAVAQRRYTPQETSKGAEGGASPRVVRGRMKGPRSTSMKGLMPIVQAMGEDSKGEQKTSLYQGLNFAGLEGQQGGGKPASVPSTPPPALAPSSAGKGQGGQAASFPNLNFSSLAKSGPSGGTFKPRFRQPSKDEVFDF